MSCVLIYALGRPGNFYFLKFRDKKSTRAWFYSGILPGSIYSTSLLLKDYEKLSGSITSNPSDISQLINRQHSTCINRSAHTCPPMPSRAQKHKGFLSCYQCREHRWLKSIYPCGERLKASADVAKVEHAACWVCGWIINTGTNKVALSDAAPWEGEQQHCKQILFCCWEVTA